MSWVEVPSDAGRKAGRGSENGRENASSNGRRGTAADKFTASHAGGYYLQVCGRHFFVANVGGPGAGTLLPRV